MGAVLRKPRPWTARDLADLAAMQAEGEDLHAMAEILERTSADVDLMLWKRLGRGALNGPERLA